MKKEFQAMFIISIFLLIVGCTTIILTPSLEMTVLSEIYSQKTDNFKISFNVINPGDTTFTGNIVYQYNKDCLQLEGANRYDSNFPQETIKVPPKDTQPKKIAVIKQFSYVNKNNPPQTDTKCFQTPLRISVLLYDDSGKLMDSRGTTITIA
ncbi:MAG: hypothetical protein NTY22_04535 [Proteobacteria bacterium]|nr:hypothetical protein [Pseudomonadota bacterium]